MQMDPPRPMVFATALPCGKRTAHVIPYPRVATFKPAVCAAVAGVAPLMGRCAEHVGQHFPDVTAGLAAKVRRHPVCADTFMFPAHEAQRRGLPADASDSGSVAAHQLAMRLAGHLRRMQIARKRAHLQHCALHLDTDDGFRPEGCPLMYAMLREAGVALDPVAEARPMPASDLLIFEERTGGRCVRIQTGCLDHVCIVTFCSDQHLHGNVFPPSLSINSPEGLALLRLVPYARRGIDAFCAAVEREPQLWLEAVQQMDARLRERVQ